MTSVRLPDVGDIVQNRYTEKNFLVLEYKDKIVQTNLYGETVHAEIRDDYVLLNLEDGIHVYPTLQAITYFYTVIA
jgi:hypothetical protein